MCTVPAKNQLASLQVCCMLSSLQVTSCGELLILITATWSNLEGAINRIDALRSASYQLQFAGLFEACYRTWETQSRLLASQCDVKLRLCRQTNLQATIPKSTSCDGSLVAFLAAKLQRHAWAQSEDCHGRHGQRCHRGDGAGPCCPVDHLFDR